VHPMYAEEYRKPDNQTQTGEKKSKNQKPINSNRKKEKEHGIPTTNKENHSTKEGRAGENVQTRIGRPGEED